ncbi:hypothetical protein ACWGAN_07890 [Streptomyces sp. NPDC054945]
MTSAASRSRARSAGDVDRDSPPPQRCVARPGTQLHWLFSPFGSGRERGRGSAAEYPVDWETIGDRRRYEADVDLTGPRADWAAHLSVVREAAVPCPNGSPYSWWRWPSS